MANEKQTSEGNPCPNCGAGVYEWVTYENGDAEYCFNCGRETGKRRATPRETKARVASVVVDAIQTDQDGEGVQLVMGDLLGTYSFSLSAHQATQLAFALNDLAACDCHDCAFRRDAD